MVHFVLASSIWLLEGPPLTDLIAIVKARRNAAIFAVVLGFLDWRGKDDRSSSAYTCVAWDTEGRQQRALVTEAPVDEGIYLATFDLAEVRNFRKAEAWRLEYQRSWR